MNFEENQPTATKYWGDFVNICELIKLNESKVGQIQFSFFWLIAYVIGKATFYNKTPLKLVSWCQRYKQLEGCKNNRKQRNYLSKNGSVIQIK